MRNNKKLLGVTGSMGCGKSYICKKLVELGRGEVYHINTDLLGREIIGANLTYIEVRSQVFQKFGYNFQANDGSVKKKELGSVLFQDKTALKSFNNIILPHALELLDKQIKGIKSELVLVESALFAEHNFFDIVGYNMLLVYANVETQMDRLSRADLPMEQIIGRINSQFSTQEKLEKIIQAQKESNSGKLFLFDTTNNPYISKYELLFEVIRGGSRK